MKRNYIKNCIKEMNSSAKLLRESFPYDDRDDEQEFEDGYGDEGYEGEVEGDGAKGENVAGGLKGDKRIAQIRTVCLQGIQDYAEDVDSEEYNFFKKLWLMCDKVVSAKESGETV